MKRFLLLVAVALMFSIGVKAQNELYSTDFQDSTEAIANWVIFTPEHPVDFYTKWHLAYYGGNDNWWLSATGYDGQTDQATVQWAIMPAITLDSSANLVINFDNRARYGTAPALEMYYSTTFAGDSASFDETQWTQITGFELDSIDSDYDFISTNATISVDAGTVYIGFKYISNDGDGCNWSIDNITVTASSNGGGEPTDIETASREVLVYPNPAQDYINVASYGQKTVTITDLTGKVVKTLNTSANIIDVSDLQSGVYTITITNSSDTYSAKFLKN